MPARTSSSPLEREAAGGRYNTAVVLDRAGAVAGKYRKNSIPLVDMPALTTRPRNHEPAMGRWREPRRP
jgi:predicted amidohydrolase